MSRVMRKKSFFSEVKLDVAVAMKACESFEARLVSDRQRTLSAHRLPVDKRVDRPHLFGDTAF